MGDVDKPLIDGGGELLVESAISCLRPQVSNIIVNCRAESAPEYDRFGATLAHDRVSDGGPLAGIEAGLTACDTKWCLVCPGDAPLFPGDLATELFQVRPGSAAYIEGHHLFMLLSTELLASLTHYLDQGERKVINWLKSVGAAPVQARDGDLYININTPEDLEAWRTR